MTRILALIFFFLILGIVLISRADDTLPSSKNFVYQGQNLENFSLYNELKSTHYREETIQATCTRQIPYQETVRVPVTRYRTEYVTIPGRNECHTEYQQVARTVTRYRQECSNVGGGIVCEMINGRRVCRTEPGHQVCRQVPYTETIWENVPRQVCNWIPPTQEARQVAYTDYEDRIETHYRTESYPCTRVVQIPYTVVDKRFQANVTMEFDITSVPAKVLFTVSLDSQGKLVINPKDQSDKAVLVAVARQETEEQVGDQIQINAQIKALFKDKESVLSPLKNDIFNIYIVPGYLHFYAGPISDQNTFQVRLTVQEENGPVVLDKILSHEQYQIKNWNNSGQVIVDLDPFNLPSHKRYKFLMEAAVNLGLGWEVLGISPENLFKRKEAVRNF